MADIVNLRQARKAKARTEREKTAAENRARHGRSKTEKQHEANTSDKARAFLDGHLLNPGGKDK